MLVLSVTSKRRKLLNTTHTEERKQIRKVAKFNSDRKQITLMLQTIVIDIFPIQPHIVNISYF